MVEVQNIWAGYGGESVLKGLSAQFLPGRITCIAGPNGCGKSTLLQTVMGLCRPESGEVLVDGAPAAQLTSRQLAQKVAYLPQSRPVPDMTAYRMVLHGRFAHLGYPRRYRAEDHAAARAALGWAGCAALAGRPLGSLSGGQRQQVYIAMALAQDAGTILMDEPTTYLDIRARFAVMDLARRLALQGRAVVLVLHDLDLALRCADELLLLQNGVTAAAGAPREVCESGRLSEVFGVAVHEMDTPHGSQYYFTPLPDTPKAPPAESAGQNGPAPG